jgi:transcriptional regulator with XRE-family HTH domain
MKPEEICNYRQALGLTQEALASALGVSSDTVSRWESGQSQPEAPQMLELALEALEIRIAMSDEELLKLEREVTAKVKRRAAK